MESYLFLITLIAGYVLVLCGEYVLISTCVSIRLIWYLKKKYNAPDGLCSIGWFLHVASSFIDFGTQIEIIHQIFLLFIPTITLDKQHQLVVLGGFYGKAVLWIPASSNLNVIRFLLVSFAGIVPLRECYERGQMFDIVNMYSLCLFIIVLLRQSCFWNGWFRTRD